MQKIVVDMAAGTQQTVEMTPEEVEAHEAVPPSQPMQPPSEMIMLDQGTGEPVKVMVKNGEAYVG